MSTAGFLRHTLVHERPLFVKVADAVLQDGLEYRPDPKARTAGEILGHLIGHNLDLEELLDDGVIHHRFQVPFDSLPEAVARLDESFASVIEKLGRVSDEEWSAAGRFYAGDHLVAEASREQLAWMMFLDSVHHRGQLSTYLRPMGSKVPAIYGPSADDKGGGH